MKVVDRNAYYLSGSLGYITLCLNPIIYASRYEVFRRCLKQMLNKNSVAATPGNTGWSVTRSGVVQQALFEKKSNETKQKKHHVFGFEKKIINVKTYQQAHWPNVLGLNITLNQFCCPLRNYY